MFTQEKLKETLHYDMDTGYFYWLVNGGSASRGKIAGHLQKTGTQQGYRRLKYKGKHYLLHRLAWLYVFGRMPLSHIDHINGVRDDNRICNLREISPSENIKHIHELGGKSLAHLRTTIKPKKFEPPKLDTELTQEHLRDILLYHEKEGYFEWKKDICNIKAGSRPSYKLPKGYPLVRVSRNGKTKKYLAHRLAWFYVYGYWPKEIDHINRDKSDYRIANLREVTRTENMANAKFKKISKHGRGVHWANGVWCSRMSQHGKVKTLGYFKKPEDAQKAYDVELKRYHEELGIAA